MEMKFRGGSLKDKFLYVAIAIMALGQWGDSKELIHEAYVTIVSNFSHQYEYEALNTVNIGSNVDFISQTFGAPQLIKKSKYIDDVNFAYYLHEKYILTLILKENRVSAYSITGLVDDFIPDGLLNKEPNENKFTIADNNQNMIDYTVDYNNVSFLLTREELGKNKLFMNQYFGAIDYQSNVNLTSTELQDLYNKINIDEASSKIKNQVVALSKKAKNNFYGAGEIDLSIIADSILTNFEYSFYYKQ